VQPAPIYDIWRLLSEPREAVEAEVRATCRTVYLGDNEALTRILGRYKMYVDTRDIGIASHLMMEGYWEMWVTEAMMRLLRRGAVVADVGANLGYFTLLMADLTGAEGHVLSFEPNPEMARRLEKSIAVNGFAGFTDFYPCGLGREEGWARMDVRDDQPGGGRTIPIAAAEAPAEAEAQPPARAAPGASRGLPSALKSFFLGQAPGDVAPPPEQRPVAGRPAGLQCARHDGVLDAPGKVAVDAVGDPQHRLAAQGLEGVLEQVHHHQDAEQHDQGGDAAAGDDRIVDDHRIGRAGEHQHVQQHAGDDHAPQPVAVMVHEPAKQQAFQD
jgi:hypothetical protein